MRLLFLNFFFFNPLLLPFLLMLPSTKIYSVKKTKKTIQITGKGTDKQWKRAKKLCDFPYPWRTDKAPETVFKALYDETHFYFLYRAIDPEIIQKSKGLGETDVVQSDRVELFFKGATDEGPYYSLELDALGRILDTEGYFRKKVDFDWTWPTNGLEVQASIDETGYWVEGRISFASLRALGLYQDDGILRTGLYRAEYVTQADGIIRPQWISWIHPDSATPNFHIPSSFGVLKLVD